MQAPDSPFQYEHKNSSYYEPDDVILANVCHVYRCEFDAPLTLPGYHDLITRVREDGSRGGVGRGSWVVYQEMKLTIKYVMI